MKNPLLLSLTLLILLLGFLSASKAGSSSDAIAIRVIPNPEYLSARGWYESQNFTGFPEALIVDGYEGIRDGRTVYVNAANIGEDNEFHTNIYLISYNQDAESDTMDIFGKILSHWKFNINITDTGVCKGDAGINCINDSECPSNDICLSKKAKIVRDTKRLGRISDFNYLIENYKNINGKYPIISAGTYIPNYTLSVWPSWYDNLGKQLGVNPPLDPINELGECEGYNEKTCWNNKAKEFATVLPELPENSNIIMYQSDEKGSFYMACAIKESEHLAIQQGICGGGGKPIVIKNNKPYFSGENLPTAISGESYAGYIESSDFDGDELTWEFKIEYGCEMFENFKMEDTAITKQKKIKADLVGAPDDCVIKVTINDNNEDGEVSNNFTITTSNSNVPIIKKQSNKTIIIGKGYDLTISISEADEQYPLTVISTGLPSGLSGEVINQHDYKISGIPIDQTKFYNVTIIATDLYKGVSDPMNFNITVINNSPEIITDSLADATACLNYNQAIEVSDPDGHTVNSYSASGLASGLSISGGTITGIPKSTGTYQVSITVGDQYLNQTISPYSAEATKDFTLNVVDEQFTVNTINDTSVYVYPSGATPPFYYGPIQVNIVASVSGSPVTYNLINNPTWLIINKDTGVIQGTPTDNVNDPGTYIITVKATNDCGISAQIDFALTVKSNKWSGDRECQEEEGEVCDIDLADCGVCCTDVIKYQHPSKTCTNEKDICTTPNKPDTYVPYPQSVYGTQIAGCSFGYWSGSSFCVGNSVNGVCPSTGCCADPPKGSFDYAEPRVGGQHEAALLCYPVNIQYTACE